MKKLLPFLILLMSLSGQATIYQIANQTAKDAFNFGSPIAGDRVQFQRGQSFSGAITLNQSGTLGNTIIIEAYGTGANPIITGFTNVTLWTNLGSNIWESTSAISELTTANVVFVNNVNTAMGRTPNAGSYYAFQSHSGSTSITSSDLTGSPNWTGAEAVMRIGHFKLDRRTITSQSAGTINWTSATSYEPENNFGFFIQNDARCLDQQNEWYFNPSTKKLLIYSTSQPTNVKVSTIDNLFTVNAGYLIVQNIDFTGANLAAIYSASTTSRQHITIQNCNFTGLGQSAILGIRCSNYLIDSNTITDSNTNGISSGGSFLTTYNITISNNVLSRIGITEGNHQSTFWNAIGAGKGVNVEYNRVINSGYHGISFYGDSITIKNNFVQNFCKILDDGGGIYSFTGGQAVTIDNKVQGNICENGIGNSTTTSGTFPTIAAGIYMDANSSNVEIYENTVSNCKSYGIFTNGTNINIHDNTVFNASDYQIRMIGWGTKSNICNANKFICKNSTQLAVHINSGANDIPSKYSGNNNYFASPIGTDDVFYVEQPSTSADRYYTLAQWKTFSSQDAASLGSPFTIADVADFRFEYNATSSPVTLTLDQNYRTLDNSDHTSITLQPYS